ncbi:MAG: Uma2 family endonuclease, partial [Symploca sp. SIO2G7]|nr:Uma2 family endonuclease [Symploca sp. SIO2G7]
MVASLQRPNLKTTQNVILEGISWNTFHTMLQEMGDHRAAKLAYDSGILEITMPSSLHEIINRLLDRIIVALTEELNLKIKAYGSTTLTREDLEKGIEPDSCYYIQKADQILSRKLDLAITPPPDLAVEVDITSFSQRRFSIYRQLQIPEVWRYTQKNGVIIYRYSQDSYIECDVSPTFSMITGDILMNFL